MQNKKKTAPSKQQKRVSARTAETSTQRSIDSFFSPTTTEPKAKKKSTTRDDPHEEKEKKKKPTKKRDSNEHPSASSSATKKRNKNNEQPVSSSDHTRPILIEDDQEGTPSLEPQQAKAGAKPDVVESGMTCPVCSKLLDCQGNVSLAERHINLCLDQPGPSVPKPPQSPTSIMQDQLDVPDTIDFEEAEEDEEEGSVKSLLSETRSDQAPGPSSAKPRATKRKTRVTKQSGRKTKVEKTEGYRKGGAGKKAVPFYKLMPGTTISVDCFSHGPVPGVSAYFLSHAHSDHYTKLSSSWKHGKIYCSKTTANLVKLKLRVDSHWIVPLDFNTPYTVDDVRVVLIDANHCPGSAMFLFEGITKPDRKPFRYLHCGDFRATPAQLRHPAIHEKVIDICYLDTTYLDPKYCFPAQDQVIQGCCKAIGARVLDDDHTATMSSKDIKTLQDIGRSRAVLKSWLQPHSASSSSTTLGPLPKKEGVPEQVAGASGEEPKQPKLASIFEPKDQTSTNEKRKSLILIGTYSIGKERIVIEVAKKLGSKVFCADARKTGIIGAIDRADEEAELQGLLSADPLRAQIHLVNLFALNKPGFLEAYLHKFRPRFNHIIGIKPTGWCYKPSTPSSIALNSIDFSAFIDTFQKQQQDDDDDEVVVEGERRGNNSRRNNPVGQLIFPEKVKPELAGLVEVYGVPYSEHSSFFELSCFCISFDWVRMIPTVNCGSPGSRAKMKGWIDRWKIERARRLLINNNTSPSALQKTRQSPETLPPPPHSPKLPSPSTTSSSLILNASAPLLIKPRDQHYW
ncbi:hypothetical protein PGT21_014753 [Puccinia graminis f. sp. tritici]|uniref:DNA repair metallo-beta-lactamase domain-containing protein n=2 Tax=Puccinia graminis f. sp. tritici TaxID=56615 RepID=A0A5B0NE13_PUCGR|nr:hypothetical protein PGT21_014753 [Puccinia graminis f. sp. tritici]